MERNRHIDCIAILKSIIESGRSETDWGSLLNHGLKLLDAISPPSHGGSFPAAGGGGAPASPTPVVMPSETITGIITNLQIMPSKSGGTFCKFVLNGQHLASFDEACNQMIPMMVGSVVTCMCACKRSACGKFVNRSVKSITAAQTSSTIPDQDIPF